MRTSFLSNYCCKTQQPYERLLEDVLKTIPKDQIKEFGATQSGGKIKKLTSYLVAFPISLDVATTDIKNMVTVHAKKKNLAYVMSGVQIFVELLGRVKTENMLSFIATNVEETICALVCASSSSSSATSVATPRGVPTEYGCVLAGCILLFHYSEARMDTDFTCINMAVSHIREFATFALVRQTASSAAAAAAPSSSSSSSSRNTEALLWNTLNDNRFELTVKVGKELYKSSAINVLYSQREVVEALLLALILQFTKQLNRHTHGLPVIDSNSHKCMNSIFTAEASFDASIGLNSILSVALQAPFEEACANSTSTQYGAKIDIRLELEACRRIFAMADNQEPRYSNAVSLSWKCVYEILLACPIVHLRDTVNRLLCTENIPFQFFLQFLFIMNSVVCAKNLQLQINILSIMIRFAKRRIGHSIHYLSRADQQLRMQQQQQQRDNIHKPLSGSGILGSPFLLGTSYSSASFTYPTKTSTTTTTTAAATATTSSTITVSTSALLSSPLSLCRHLATSRSCSSSDVEQDWLGPSGSEAMLRGAPMDMKHLGLDMDALICWVELLRASERSNSNNYNNNENNYDNTESIVNNNSSNIDKGGNGTGAKEMGSSNSNSNSNQANSNSNSNSIRNGVRVLMLRESLAELMSLLVYVIRACPQVAQTNVFDFNSFPITPPATANNSNTNINRDNSSSHSQSKYTESTSNNSNNNDDTVPRDAYVDSSSSSSSSTGAGDSASLENRTAVVARTAGAVTLHVYAAHTSSSTSSTSSTSSSFCSPLNSRSTSRSINSSSRIGTASPSPPPPPPSYGDTPPTLRQLDMLEQYRMHAYTASTVRQAAAATTTTAAVIDHTGSLSENSSSRYQSNNNNKNSEVGAKELIASSGSAAAAAVADDPAAAALSPDIRAKRKGDKKRAIGQDTSLICCTMGVLQQSRIALAMKTIRKIFATASKLTASALSLSSRSSAPSTTAAAPAPATSSINIGSTGGTGGDGVDGGSGSGRADDMLSAGNCIADALLVRIKTCAEMYFAFPQEKAVFEFFYSCGLNIVNIVLKSMMAVNHHYRYDSDRYGVEHPPSSATSVLPSSGVAFPRPSSFVFQGDDDKHSLAARLQSLALSSPSGTSNTANAITSTSGATLRHSYSRSVNKPSSSSYSSATADTGADSGASGSGTSRIVSHSHTHTHAHHSTRLILSSDALKQICFNSAIDSGNNGNNSSDGPTSAGVLQQVVNAVTLYLRSAVLDQIRSSSSKIGASNGVKVAEPSSVVSATVQPQALDSIHDFIVHCLCTEKYANDRRLRVTPSITSTTSVPTDSHKDRSSSSSSTNSSGCLGRVHRTIFDAYKLSFATELAVAVDVQLSMLLATGRAEMAPLMRLVLGLLQIWRAQDEQEHQVRVMDIVRAGEGRNNSNDTKNMNPKQINNSSSSSSSRGGYNINGTNNNSTNTSNSNTTTTSNNNNDNNIDRTTFGGSSYLQQLAQLQQLQRRCQRLFVCLSLCATGTILHVPLLHSIGLELLILWDSQDQLPSNVEIDLEMYTVTPVGTTASASSSSSSASSSSSSSSPAPSAIFVPMSPRLCLNAHLTASKMILLRQKDETTAAASSSSESSSGSGSGSVNNEKKSADVYEKVSDLQIYQLLTKSVLSSRELCSMPGVMRVMRSGGGGASSYRGSSNSSVGSADSGGDGGDGEMTMTTMMIGRGGTAESPAQQLSSSYSNYFSNNNNNNHYNNRSSSSSSSSGDGSGNVKEYYCPVPTATSSSSSSSAVIAAASKTPPTLPLASAMKKRQQQQQQDSSASSAGNSFSASTGTSGACSGVSEEHKESLESGTPYHYPRSQLQLSNFNRSNHTSSPINNSYAGGLAIDSSTINSGNSSSSSNSSTLGTDISSRQGQLRQRYMDNCSEYQRLAATHTVNLPCKSDIKRLLDGL